LKPTQSTFDYVQPALSLVLTAKMDMLQVVLTAALFIAHVGGLVACNDTAFNTTHTVTVFTTITPIATNFCLGSNFNKVLPTYVYNSINITVTPLRPTLARKY
jgi:hypothetical protein